MAKKTKNGLIKFDICKVNTHRLRKMTDGQLQRAQANLFDHKRQWDSKTAKVYKFINALEGVVYFSGQGRDAIDADLAASHKHNATKYEEQIWQLQVKKRCRIKLAESIARDAWREGNHELAAKVRKEHGLGKTKRVRR